MRSSNSTTLLFAVFLTAGQQAMAALTLYNQTATFYYDNNAPIGGDGGQCIRENRLPASAKNWNDGNFAAYPACGSEALGQTYANLNTDRIVSISQNLVGGANKALCGKEVKVFNKEGIQIVLDEGPFFVFEGCELCKTEPRVDFSVKAYAKLCGGSCGVDAPDQLKDPTGFRIEITDNTVFPSKARE